MNPVTSAMIGLVFLGVGVAATYLMYHLWGYPFDKATRKSEAPKSLMRIHRLLGFVFAVLYLYMLFRMLPRMWSYQVELPARTVAHLLLGMGLGFLLLIKISIMRFFRHLEEWMPYLGTAICLCAVLLIGLSAPFAFRERVLASSAAGGSAFSTENRARVAELLPQAGYPKEAPLTELSTEEGLREGRGVLLNRCVRCHDLKTVLNRPRTPADWLRTVTRMAEKPALFEPFTLEETWHVAAYLVAITPDLQRSSKNLRSGEVASNNTKSLLAVLEGKPPEGVDPAVAEVAFKKTCSQCHTHYAVEDAAPESQEDAKGLIRRMIENGLDCEEEDLRLVYAHLMGKYVEKK